MRKGPSDERERFWRDLLERQPRSGLNITRFCAQAGVSQNSFYVWKRRLQALAQASRPAMRRRPRRRGKAVANSSSLVPVRLIPDLGLPSPAAQAIEVAWPSGLTLRIPANCDSKTLREVFGLVASTMNGASPSC
jgi:hypothetical protein